MQSLEFMMMFLKQKSKISIINDAQTPIISEDETTLPSVSLSFVSLNLADNLDIVAGSPLATTVTKT